jgi:hypothetical protein
LLAQPAVEAVDRYRIQLVAASQGSRNELEMEEELGVLA